MRTTLRIDAALFEEAARLTGIREKNSLVRAGLEALILRAAGRRLAAMGGSDPKAAAGARRRSLRRSGGGNKL